MASRLQRGWTIISLKRGAKPLASIRSFAPSCERRGGSAGRRRPCLRMVGLIALLVSAVAAYLPHLVLGSHLNVMQDFLLGSVTGGIAYVVTYYQLKKLLRGD